MNCKILSFMILYFLSISVSVTFAESIMKPKPMPKASELVPVPKDMQQRWIVKTCEKGGLAYRFSEHFLLVSVRNGSKLFRIGGFGDEGGDRYSMTMPAEKVGFVMGTKGDLILYYGDTKTSFPIEAVENKKLFIPHIMLKNCTADGPLKIKEDVVMVSLLPGFDKIHKACPEKTDIYKADCQKSIFTLFDADDDGALNLAEMKYGWNTLLPYSKFTTCGPLANKNDELRADGQAYFSWMFEHLDKNKDQKISFDEIQGQWSVMQGDVLMSGATNLLMAAEGPLDLLPDNIEMTCTNCCIAVGTAAP